MYELCYIRLFIQSIRPQLCDKICRVASIPFNAGMYHYNNVHTHHTTHTHTPSRWHEIFRALFLIIACHRIFLSINILGNKNGNKHSLGLQFMIFGTKQMRFRNFSLVFCFESLLKFCILQLLFEVMYQNKALECI